MKPATTPLDQSPQLVELAAYAPPDGKQLILVHSVASLYRTLRNSDIAADAIAQLPNESQLHLASLLLGNSEAVVWFDGEQPRAVVRASPLRRMLATTVASVAGAPLTSRDSFLFYADSGATRGAAPNALTALAAGMPGSIFIFDRSSKADSFPPLSRPSITAVESRDGALLIHARANASAPAPAAATGGFELPADAMLSIIFHGDSDALGDLDRILPLRLDRLASGGVLLSLYSIEASGRLLPRPRGVIVLPENEESRQAVASIFNAATIPGLDSPATSRQIGSIKVDRIERLGATIEVARDRGRLIVGMDSKSLDRYFAGKRDSVAAENGEVWVLKGDPAQLRPVVDDLAEQPALRLLAPKIVRRARDTRKVLNLLGGAKSISGVRRIRAPWEEIELTVTPQK
jgi:hypothetical protein